MQVTIAQVYSQVTTRHYFSERKSTSFENTNWRGYKIASLQSAARMHKCTHGNEIIISCCTEVGCQEKQQKFLVLFGLSCRGSRSFAFDYHRITKIIFAKEKYVKGKEKDQRCSYRDQMIMRHTQANSICALSLKSDFGRFPCPRSVFIASELAACAYTHKLY